MTTERPVTTIRDIAALAGVSAGTISRVMNDKPGVGESTRARINALIEQHDFHGDATARQLSRGRSECLGIVFPLQVSEVIMHPVYPELLGAISDATQAAGYDVILFTTKASNGVDHIVDAVRRKRVDGLILPAASSDDALIQRIINLAVPTVLIGHRQSAERMTWVDCSHDEAMYALTRRLLERGRRSLTLVNGPTRISAYQLRSEGFWRAMAEFPEAIAEEIDGDVGYAAGLMVGTELLARATAPDAILCSADGTAVGVMESIEKASARIPEDVAVTGFDDSDFASHTSPPLTSVRMPLDETGSAAVSLLLEMLVGEGSPPEPRILKTVVVERDSDR